MGNEISGCQKLTGESKTICLWTNGYITNGADRAGTADGAKKTMGQYVPADEVSDFYDFQVACNSGAYDPDHAVGCYDYNEADDLQNNNIKYGGLASNWGVKGDHLSSSSWLMWPRFQAERFNFYNLTKKRIEATCGKDHYDKVWPYFYYMANTDNGKAQIQSLIDGDPTIPQPCRDALMNNHTDAIQRQYGLMNAPNPATVTDQYDESGVGTSQAYWTGIDPNDPKLLAFWTNKTILETDYSTELYGNPNWTYKERQDALRKVMGKDVATGKDFIDEWAQRYVNFDFVNPGRNADDYFQPGQHPGRPNWVTDNPMYMGQLPQKPKNPTGSTAYGAFATDPKGYGYVDHCGDETPTEKYLPYIVGGVAGALAGLVIPGSYSRLSAAATAGGAGFYLTESIYGWNALTAWFGKDFSKQSRAAEILSVGAPVTLVLMLYEVGLIPARFDTERDEMILAVSAAAGGYLVLNPILTPLLDVGGSILTLATAPISGVEKLVQTLFNGCAGHNMIFKYACRCESAKTKPAMAEALLGPVYGTTGAQYTMRKQCLEAAMTSGSWGANPYYMGTCDKNGHTDDPTACLSAGEWAYQTWPTDVGVLAQKKWDEIKHCLDDPTPNSSFFPPLDKDKPCVAKYGEHFRLGADTTCYDYRAPNGEQEPRQYVWPVDKKSNEECVIL